MKPLFLLFVNLFFAAAQAQPLTVTELVTLALENNPETKIAWWNAEKAAAQVGDAKSGYYPVIDLAGGIQNGRDYKYINGPNTSYTIVGIDLLMSLMLYDFGERDANVQAAKCALLKAEWQSSGALQRVILEVLESAYSALHAQEGLAYAEISCQEAKLLHDAAKNLHQAGLSPITDVYATESTLALMTISFLESEKLLQFQMAKLAAAIGNSSECPLEIAPLEEMAPLPMQKVEALMCLARQYRADLLAKQGEICQAQYRQRQIEAQFSPKFYFTAGGGANYAFHDKSHGGQYKVALNFDMPLFEGFSQCYRNRMARSEVQMSMEELNQLEIEAALEIQKFSLTVSAAQEMIVHAENNLNNALKAYEGFFEMYRAGKERLSEVAIAQKQLAHARMLYSDIRTQLLTGTAHLAYATGMLYKN